LSGLEPKGRTGLDFEVIVVDDGSTDGSLAWLQRQTPSYPFKVYSQANMGPGGARNQGAKVAVGEILLFLDADIVASAELLQAHRQAHQEHGHALIAGRIRQWNPNLGSPGYKVFAEIYDYGTSERRFGLFLWTHSKHLDPGG